MRRLKNIWKFIILISSTLILFGCPEELPYDDMNVTIINNSDNEIIFHVRPIFNSIKDTSLYEEFPWGSLDRLDTSRIVLPNSTLLDGFCSYCYEDILNEGWIIFYFYNLDTIKSVPWSTIYEKYMLVDRVDFDTWEDLEECNFTITISNSNSIK